MLAASMPESLLLRSASRRKKLIEFLDSFTTEKAEKAEDVFLLPQRKLRKLRRWRIDCTPELKTYNAIVALGLSPAVDGLTIINLIPSLPSFQFLNAVFPEVQTVRSTGWAVWNLLNIAAINKTITRNS